MSKAKKAANSAAKTETPVVNNETAVDQNINTEESSEDENLEDDLLGSDADDDNESEDEQSEEEKAELEAAAAEAEIEKLIEDQKKALKDLQAKKKALKTGTTAKKETKGIEVTFTNKAGEVIKGKGVLYYVVRQGGKLHYKEASAVKVLENPNVEVPAPAKEEESTETPA